MNIDALFEQAFARTFDKGSVKYKELCRQFFMAGVEASKCKPKVCALLKPKELKDESA
jgi:hypothetical protein